MAIKTGWPIIGYPVFYNVGEGGKMMTNFCKPTWPKGLNKWEFIRFILKSKDLSKMQKVMLILFVLGMEETSKWKKW